MKARPTPVEQQKRAAWHAFVAEQLPALYRYVRHELGYLEGTGALMPGELSAEDVVDSALLRAQREFLGDPAGSNARAWLIRRVREQLDAEVRRLQAQRARTVPLQLDTSEVPEPTAVPSEDGSVMFYEPQELTPEDLFPDIDLPPSPEQEMETRELQACVDAVLLQMPSDWRQALQLHYLDGFGAAELAHVLGRPEQETRRLLEDARNAVRRKLQEAGCSFTPEGGGPEQGRKRAAAAAPSGGGGKGESS